MRSTHCLLLFVGALGPIACGTSSSPSGNVTTDAAIVVDVGVDGGDALDEDALVCPPPLGIPTPRPTRRPPAGPLDDVLRMNQIQLEATHNSYHLQPEAKLIDWSYSHAPLGEQFESQGVRGVELDVHWDEDCNRYRVFHLLILDPRSTCQLFTDCLTTVRDWSYAHQGHHPIFVHIEPKDGYDPDVNEARMVALEREILSVFPREAVITPDEVKGSSPTLVAALEGHGWPTLGATRGRVLFYLDRSDEMRDDYTHGRHDLDGRLVFADADATDPFAAVRVLNDPIGQKDEIAAALARGTIVRTFAEKSIESARAGERTQLEAALAGGAQIVSTDFPAKVDGTSYFVEIPAGTPSRCNPITSPKGCTADAVESPDRLR